MTSTIAREFKAAAATAVAAIRRIRGWITIVAAFAVLGAPAAGAAEAAWHASAALQPALYEALARDAGSAIHLDKAGCASLPARPLQGCFDKQGVRFAYAGAPAFGLRLVVWGRGKTLRDVHAVRPATVGNRVEYRHGILTEWWRVLPVGFEQGFTIDQRPAGAGKLMLALAATQAAQPAGSDVAFGDLRYGRFAVIDADGRMVPVAVQSQGARVRIVVDDRNARYPLTIDPLVWIGQKVTASDGEDSDYFGSPVALSGTTAVIGAPEAIVDGNLDQGAAYVFTETGGTWSEVQKLTASDGGVGDQFGMHIAVSADTAMIAANGGVYVFTRSDGRWTETQKLIASDSSAVGSFGGALAIDGTTAVIGAHAADVGANSSQGLAYVFTNSGGTWSQSAVLTASDGVANDHFGASAAISGGTAVIGALYAATSGVNMGAAYVFNDSSGTWTQTAKLLPDDGADNDVFGQAVALDGRVALVGAYEADVDGDADRGAVYAFSESGGVWAQTQKLVASDGAPSDLFGSDVALSGTTALIGAPGAASGSDQYAGAAYVFLESGGAWTEAQKLSAADGGAYDAYGFYVALDGNNGLVGSPDLAPPASGVAPRPGKAFFYGNNDLTLTMDAPDKIAPDVRYTSRIITMNNSSAASSALTATSDVPAGAAFVSAEASQGSCSETAGIIACAFGAVAGDGGTATANITLTATGAAGETVEQTAAVANAAPALTASDTSIVEYAPVAEDATLTTDENTAADGQLKATDADDDDESLTYGIVTQPAHGQIELDATTGAYTYTPDGNYTGADSFTFNANDGVADSNTATVSVTVRSASSSGSNQVIPPGSIGGGGALGWFALTLLGLVGLRRDNPTRPAAPSMVRRTPAALVAGLVLALGLPLAQAAAPAPGAALGSEFGVNTHTAGDQAEPAMAMDAAGRFVVTWTEYSGQDGAGLGIFAQRYHADGTPDGAEFQVNTDTAGNQESPAVAMDAAGDFVVAWTDLSGEDGDGDGIFAQRYHADGTAAGAEFQVNTYTGAGQVSPAVAMDASGNFVVTWTDLSGEDGSGKGVFAQRYLADGTPDGAEFQVNTTYALDQATPAVAMGAAGGFVIAWTDSGGADGSGYGVFAQRYKADGAPAGGEFQVNTSTAGTQLDVAVAMDAAGNFVVTWTDMNAEDGDGDGVFAQRYHADGSSGGAEFRINTHTTGDQRESAVAMAAAGGFVVSWTDLSGEDGSANGVFAQRYQADGTPVGNEFRVNTDTAGSQFTSALAMDAAGDFAASWTDFDGEDGDGRGVFGQRYAREASLDLEATLAVAPATAVEPDNGLTLTAGINNAQTPATLTGNATIDDALTAASGLTATLTLPEDATFGGATGTNWTCPAAPTGNTLTCTYGASLAAATASENLVVNLTAPGSAGVSLESGNTVFGSQPDTGAGNNAASVSVVTDTAPMAVNSSLTVDQDSTGNGTLKGSDADGDSLTFAATGDPAHGNVKVNADGSYTYTPTAGYSGSDSFAFRASDGKLDSNTATVSIVVRAAASPPDDGAGDGSAPQPAPGPGTSVGSGGGGGTAPLGLILLAGLAVAIRRRG